MADVKVALQELKEESDSSKLAGAPPCSPGSADVGLGGGRTRRLVASHRRLALSRD